MLSRLWDVIKNLFYDILHLEWGYIPHQFAELWSLLKKDYSSCELMDLDSLFFQWFSVRIKQFRKQHTGYPGYMTPEHWNKILDKMVKLSEFLANYKEDEHDFVEYTDTKEYRQFMYYFSRYLKHLWH